MSEKSQERRLSIIPLSSLLTSFQDSLSFSSAEKSPKYPSDPKKSPRNFDAGAVGLGIVAAMSDAGCGAQDPIPSRFGASSPRSDPIPIVPGKAVTKFGKRVPPPSFQEAEEEEMELSESYTCVVSHVGGKSTRKREYFERAETIGGGGGRRGTDWENTEVFLASPPLLKADFLNACYLCRKKLHGLDIFMYRGDKAFCSAECRCQQILIDEQHKENCGSGARKPLDCSVSPCSAPGLFTAGVVAA